MRKELDKTELSARIDKNFKRFDDEYYRIEGVFQEYGADWPGDKEGRALLSFVSHYKISGRKIPCMEQLLEKMPEKTNEFLYFDAPVKDVIHEQQLSGHSWLLRGLCEHYMQFGDEFSLRAVKSIAENLYLPLRGKFCTYPIEREEKNSGQVSGNSRGVVDGWMLSTDTGCAFMSLDGLSQAYEVTKDQRIAALFEEMSDKFASMDKVGMKLQTHCTLTAARGNIRMYKLTKNPKYLEYAKEIMHIYTEKGGMTRTYQNFNWWGRPDSWTEPCAIVDSLMLALELYKLTGDEKKRTLAARIYLNGLATSQRDNGGAGTETIVTDSQPWLRADMPEAFFCCSMRLAEGLWYIYENQDLLWYEENGAPEYSDGVYMDGDVMYAEVSGENSDKYAGKSVNIDGRKLTPILKYYKIPFEDAKKINQKILF